MRGTEWAQKNGHWNGTGERESMGDRRCLGNDLTMSIQHVGKKQSELVVDKHYNYIIILAAE